MNCPYCNTTITIFNIEESLFKSKVYCENCKKFVEFPLSLRELKKCQCGLTFKQIYEKKFLGCEDCHETFRNELKVFIQHQNLDEIYLLEKVSYRDFALKKDTISHSRLKIFLESYHNFLNSTDNSFSNIPILNNINLFEIKKENYQISFRMRYTRNLPTIPYDLENKNIYFISKIFFSDNFIFKKILNHHNNVKIHDFEDKNFYNVKVYTYCLNSTEIFLRFYIGDEDHFRIDSIDFGNFNNDDNIMDQVQLLSRNLINVYELFQTFDLLFPWQFKTEYGFLTKCPTNTGSGIRLYVRIKTNKENHLKLLHFFQRNPFFLRLKNYGLRGDRGEGSEMKKSITLGWDLPYLDLKKFKIDLEKKLIIWLYEVLSNTRQNKK